MRLRSLVLAAAATGVLFSGPAFAGAVLDRIVQNKKMVMSTDPEYPPQSSLNASNQFEGFDIDVGTEIAKRLGVSIEFVTPGWETIVSGKWAGRWDVSVGSMTPTKARAEVLDFPAIYYYTPASLAVHSANTTIKTPADASGKTIGVGAATTYENYLRGDLVIDAGGAPPFQFVVKDAKIQSYDTDVPALDDLKLGDGTRLDAVATALPTIQGAIKNGYPIKVVGSPLFYEPLSVAIEKGDPELTAKLAEIVKTMHEDGTLTKLSMKWYGADLTKPAA
ncbi:transporter substrate-binding domain-containing protein [Inquilinus sp. YAF38]|uniref:transporter substrate-binding domain-containing protein n=1 Tax=Inquilinus sp. YAF38 TaxID=3233084 RepID=UPI003F92D10E